MWRRPGEPRIAAQFAAVPTGTEILDEDGVLHWTKRFSNALHDGAFFEFPGYRNDHVLRLIIAMEIVEQIGLV